MQYIYIHGFNSGPQSRSGKALEQLLGVPVLRICNDYSLPYWECLKAIENQIEEKAPNLPLCIMGTSLGAFYALQLRLARIWRVAAWNPVIFPALQLAQFVGENTRFTDGSKWHFSRNAQLSYAQAPDPRQWNNFSLNDSILAGQELISPDRYIFIGDHDTLLDHELSWEYWQDHAQLTSIDSGHSIEDFSHALPILR